MTFNATQLADVHAAVVRSIEEKDAEMFASLYTEDGALLLPDGSIISGRGAIAGAFKSWLEAGFVRQQVEVIDLHSDGSLAVEEGRAAGTFSTEAGEQVSQSNYLIVHLLGADGRWLMHRDIWTAVGKDSGAGY